MATVEEAIEQANKNAEGMMVRAIVEYQAVERLDRDAGGLIALDAELDADPLLCLTCTGVVGMTCSCPD